MKMKAFFICGILIGLICFSKAGPLRLRKRAAFYIANETACVVDDTVYSNGEPIPTEDPCEACRCRPPGFACVLKECIVRPGCRSVRRHGECCPEYVCGCEHNGHLYADGEEIRDGANPCYSCHCQGSAIACAFQECVFRADCEAVYIDGECCPRFHKCSDELPENITINFESLNNSQPNLLFPIPTILSIPEESESPKEEKVTDLPDQDTTTSETSLVRTTTESQPPSEESKNEDLEKTLPGLETTTPRFEHSSTITVEPLSETVENSEIDLLKTETEVKAVTENEKIDSTTTREESTTSNVHLTTPSETTDIITVHQSSTPKPITEESTHSEIDNTIDHEKRLRFLKNNTSTIQKNETVGDSTENENSSDETNVPTEKFATDKSFVTEESIQINTDAAVKDGQDHTSEEAVDDKEQEANDSKPAILLFNTEDEKSNKEHIETVTYTFLVVDPDNENKPTNEVTEKEILEPGVTTTILDIMTDKVTVNPESETGGPEIKEFETHVENPKVRLLEDTSLNESKPIEETQTATEKLGTKITTGQSIENVDQLITETIDLESTEHVPEVQNETEGPKNENGTSGSQITAEASQLSTESSEKLISEQSTDDASKDVDPLVEFILKNNQPEKDDEKHDNSTIVEAQTSTKEL